jgi:hypothetical protein
MRQERLRVWFAPEDLKGGDYFSDQIDRAIHVHDRLLLVLSENSMASNWVIMEIKRARKVEEREGRKKLFPISLTGYEVLRGWECLDHDSGVDLAEEVRKCLSCSRLPFAYYNENSVKAQAHSAQPPLPTSRIAVSLGPPHL